jgi:hypothetical protein
MTTLCKIENGVVTNRASFAGEVPDGWIPEGETWVEDEEAQIGWTYADGVFAASPAPAVEGLPVGVPGSITARQGKINLLRMGLMTAEEASAGTMPTFLSSVTAKMPDEEAAEIVLTWREAAIWYRDDPLFGGSLLEAASSALGQPATADAVDQFFIAASAI